jgi:nitroreductase
MLRTMRRLRAVRDYAPDPVSDEDLLEILSVARWTGSAENRQPWRFVVVRDPAALARLAALMPDAPQVGRAPVAIVVVLPGERAVLDAFDEGRVAERILLAAAALELAGAIGWVPQEARGAAANLIGAPAGRLVRTVVAVGHPPREPAPRRPRGAARMPLDELAFDERWDAHR